MAPRSTRVVPETQVRSPARSFTKALDDFYAPSRDARGEQSIQQGAQAFSGLLGEKAARAKKEQRQNEHSQGVQDAMREQAGQELKGVKTGSLFRQHSSYYMMGLNETRGKAAAAKFKNDLSLKYQEWEGRHTDDDGTAFREWMNNQIGEFMGGMGDNQYMVAGAMPTINEVANNFAVQHTSFTSQRLEQESFEAYDEIVSGVFTDLSSGTIDMEGAIARIASEADDMYATDGAAAKERVVGAAIRYANIHNNPDSILALAKAHDSGKLKLSQGHREKLANAMDAVEADIERETNKANRKASAEEKAREDAAINSWANILQEDPYADLNDLEGYHELPGSVKRSMMQYQETAIRSSQVENPAITANQRMTFEARLQDATNAAERMSILNDFVLSNPTALSGSDVKSYMKDIFAKNDPSSLVNDPLVKQYRSGFGEMLGQFQTDEFSVESVSLLKTMGQRYFDDYMLRAAGSVDMQDPEAVSGVIDKAEAFAVKALTKQFPTMMSEGVQAGGARGAAGQALGADQAVAEEAASIYQQSAGVTQEEPQVSEEAPEVAPEATKEAPQEAGILSQAADAVTGWFSGDDEEAGGEMTRLEQHQVDTIARANVDLNDPEKQAEVATSLEEHQANLEAQRQQAEPVEPIYEDKEFAEDEQLVRSGFHGELLQRFTDGKDDRKHTHRNAIEVFDEDPEFASAVDALGAELGVEPMALMAVMDFESGFSTTIKNAAGSGATGLIQFMPKTARQLGTTTRELASMNRKQQMVYVRKYFKQFGNRLSGGNVEDIYMAVLWPAAIGKPEGYPIFRKGTIAYTQNKGLDTNGDGTVTKYEAASKVSRKFYGY